MTIKLLVIALGGAFGAVLRYGCEGLVHRAVGPGFPWGTMAVNVAGCLFIGFLWTLTERSLIAPRLQTFLLVGVIGAFTTFSTYTLESVNLIRDGETALGVWNLALSNALGLGALLAGLFAARWLLVSLSGTP